MDKIPITLLINRNLCGEWCIKSGGKFKAKCQPPFTLVGKIAGARPVITFPNSSVSVDLQSLERILAAILNTLEWKLLHMEIRALPRE